MHLVLTDTAHGWRSEAQALEPLRQGVSDRGLGNHRRRQRHGSADRQTLGASHRNARREAMATYFGVMPGTADLTSETDIACLHSTPRRLPPQR